MYPQTGISPNKRTATACFAWIAHMYNGQEVENFWIDISQGGLAQALDVRANLQAAQDLIEVGHTFPVSQYHVYYQDGGHARPRTTNDITNAEKACNHYYPELGAKILSPTPEYWIQEGITENPYYTGP